jgi:hypothetical protein
VVTGAIALAVDPHLGGVGLGGHRLGSLLGLLCLLGESLRLGRLSGGVAALLLAPFLEPARFRGVGLGLVAVRRGAFAEAGALNAHPLAAATQSHHGEGGEDQDDDDDYDDQDSGHPAPKVRGDNRSQLKRRRRGFVRADLEKFSSPRSAAVGGARVLPDAARRDPF